MRIWIFAILFPVSLYASDRIAPHCLVDEKNKLTLSPCVSLPNGWTVNQGAKTFCWSLRQERWLLIKRESTKFKQHPPSSDICQRVSHIPDSLVSRSIYGCFCLIRTSATQRFKECHWEIPEQKEEYPYIKCFKPSEGQSTEILPKHGWSSLTDWTIYQEGDPYCEPCDHFGRAESNQPRAYRNE